jgi:CDP-diacylglycerol--glycerol-3-phosphate 3-phosphatidyltransferase
MNSQINLPNILTSIRLILTPVLALLFINDEYYPTLFRFSALFIVIISELTDMFDGYMARKRGQVTDFGKILDPMADSIYRDTIFLCLAVVQEVSLLLVLPILYRDSIISTLRTVCAYRGIVVAARWSGKMKAIIQAVIIILILILRIFALYVPYIAGNIYWISNALLSIATIMTLYSAVDYMRNLLPMIRRIDEENSVS